MGPYSDREVTGKRHCCIPLFAADLSRGDVVRAETRDGMDLMVAEVVQPSGSWTFRIWLGKSSEPIGPVAIAPWIWVATLPNAWSAPRLRWPQSSG